MRLLKSNWETALLICRKCEKRQKFPLAKKLKKALNGGRKRKAALGVIEVKCLGVCPRHAVTMVDARRPGEWLLVRPDESIEDLARKIAVASSGTEAEDQA